jgi:CDP-glycerol glycerophosphotransferase (TagB/SpsB family)
MITDISGVALEFLALLKPVIYIDCPDFFSKTLALLYRDFGSNTADSIRNDPKFNAGRHVGYIVDNIEKLSHAVEFLLTHPAYKAGERSEFAKQLRYNPGSASGEAAKTIMDLLHLEQKLT